MRYLVFLLFAIAPAYAYTPEELIGERQIPKPECKDGVCKIKEDDLEFIVQRSRLMEALAMRLYDRLQGCRGERGV